MRGGGTVAGILAALVLVLAGPGSPTPVRTLPVYGTPQLLLELPQTGFTSVLAAADFNGDGLVDVVVARLRFQTPEVFPLTILLNDGAGGFVDGTSILFVGPPPSVQHPRKIVVADFNGDGRPDIFVADHGDDRAPFPGFQNQLVLSTPEGKLASATANLPQQSDFTHSAAAADIDGDGDLDLYVGNIYGQTNIPPQLWLNDGAGHFTVAEGRLPAPVTDLSRNKYTASHFVDVNNDGFPDLVLGGEDLPTPSVVLLNDSTGHFSLLPNALPPKPFAPNAIALDIQSADLNHDGHMDLLIAFTKSNPFYVGRWIQVLINNGDGTFRDETAARLPQSDNSANWIKFLELVDIDGDGNPDLATRLAEGNGESPPFYLNDGNGVFTALPPGFGNIFQNLYVMLDIDGDGGRDFLTSRGASPTFPERHYIVRDTGPAIVPGIPTEVGASKGGFADRVRVGWRYVWGATGYEVWRSASPGSPGSLIGTATRTTFDDTTVPGASTFYYSVRALNAAGRSAPSRPAAGWLGSLRLTLGTNAGAFSTGDSLVISLGVENPGLPLTVDFYFGALLPDGDTVVFFTDLLFSSATGRLSAPATLGPIVAGVDLTAPFTFRDPAFFTYRWTGTEPAGSYILFLAAMKPGALVDNSVDPGDIVVLATSVVTFTP